MQRLQLIERHLQYWVLKNIRVKTFPRVGTLKDKTMVITGGSRGIGLAIALRAAKDGANIAILAKTDQENSKVPGTIYDAAKKIEKAGGKALPIKCDIRFEDQVESAISQVVARFGGIDILINNASAANMSSTLNMTMKNFDLIHSINVRGTFMTSKYCIPHMLKSENPHIISISPPLDHEQFWWSQCFGYAFSKTGMSMVIQGLSDEYKGVIGVNAVWPRTGIATNAQTILGGTEVWKFTRTDAIVSDATYVVITSDCKKVNGNFFVDDEILGPMPLNAYNFDPSVELHKIAPDYFI